MIVLGFDTSGASCSAAVLRDGAVAASRAVAMERGHAQALAPMLRDVMAEAGLGFDRLDAVGVTIGPGAFTGIRIGLAAARGFGLALGIPVYGVTGFAAIAAAAEAELRAGEVLLVAIESRRAELFAQTFVDARMASSGAVSIAPAALADFVPPGAVGIAGDAAARAGAALEAAGRAVRLLAARIPDPVVVARLAAERWQGGERPPPPSPFYLRAPDVTVRPSTP
jgi:tRNA threonylcarbamoyladenosine biosynthesis protein TsaB